MRGHPLSRLTTLLLMCTAVCKGMFAGMIPLTDGDSTANAAKDKLPDTARAAIYRQSFVAKILHDVWARWANHIVEASDAHQREKELRENHFYKVYRHSNEHRGLAAAFGGLGSPAIPRLRPIPEELQREQRKLWPRFAARGRGYMARVDELWRTHSRFERITRADVFGHSEHRPVWDEAAKAATEAYILSFYGERAAHHQFWQMVSLHRVAVPDKFRVVKKAPFVVQLPRKRQGIQSSGEPSGSDPKHGRGQG